MGKTKKLKRQDRSSRSRSIKKKELDILLKQVESLKRKYKRSRDTSSSSSTSGASRGTSSCRSSYSRSRSRSKIRSRSPRRRRSRSRESNSRVRSRTRSCTRTRSNTRSRSRSDASTQEQSGNGKQLVKTVGESTEQQIAGNPESNKPKKLDILGEDPSKLNQKEVKLHTDLIPRWKHWLSSGLTDQAREELMKKYPRKGDCLLEPPQLNPEVKIPMNDVARKRDDHFQDIQRLAGSALSAIGPAISNLLGEEELNPLNQLEMLSDAGKLIIDLHHSVSKAFITPRYSKSVKEILDSASDNQAFLFGEKLSEKVSEVKSLEKTSKDMKPSYNSKNLTPKSSGSLNTKSSSSRNFETSRLSNRYPSRTNQSNFRGAKSTPSSTRTSTRQRQ